ncbi:hypothetical protein Q5P01_002621 [Channa striata]|uniref:Uncharacterized protein n=1 Tax=Channa striata TaxID=64152 RepID=A0AA88T6D6_CHASR|nr:hypothetical protein Q5P01_002621 [Channa striata]
MSTVRLMEDKGEMAQLVTSKAKLGSLAVSCYNKCGQTSPPTSHVGPEGETTRPCEWQNVRLPFFWHLDHPSGSALASDAGRTAGDVIGRRATHGGDRIRQIALSTARGKAHFTNPNLIPSQSRISTDVVLSSVLLKCPLGLGEQPLDQSKPFSKQPFRPDGHISLRTLSIKSAVLFA